jgi:hypothetical protein
LRIKRSTVRSEISKLSILSSPWILGDPHVGFSTTIRKISARTSLLTRFLPATVRCRESHAQYWLNPALCQRTTVSGWTMIRACFQPLQIRLSRTQKSLSRGLSFRRGCLAFRIAICCRKSKFSSNSFWRGARARTRSPKNNLNNRSTGLLYQANPCANQILDDSSSQASTRNQPRIEPLNCTFQYSVTILARDS